MSLKKASTTEKMWVLRNLDTGDEIAGQFAAEIGQEVRNNWAHHTALSRGNAVTMFLNSEVDRYTLESIFYAKDTSDLLFTKFKINKILEWAKPTQAKSRPAILRFTSGDGHIARTVVIAGVNNIKYGEPTVTGAMRQVTFTVNLDAYDAFDINESADYETRYARAKERDYYEMLCWREYQLPMLGDVIRKRHAFQPQLVPGDIVKLPSVEAIRTEITQLTSVALTTSFGRKDTPQRALRIDMFNRRNKKYTSHVIR
jgi:hypothetical protein